MQGSVAIALAPVSEVRKGEVPDREPRSSCAPDHVRRPLAVLEAIVKGHDQCGACSIEHLLVADRTGPATMLRPFSREDEAPHSVSFSPLAGIGVSSSTSAMDHRPDATAPVDRVQRIPYVFGVLPIAIAAYQYTLTHRPRSCRWGGRRKL